MNRNELKLKLVKLDHEKAMVTNYLKNSVTQFSTEIYQNALDYINSQIDLTLNQLENFQEKTYEH